jgi:hypothetical protein
MKRDLKIDIPKKNMYIECRRWFQKTYGNTYHTVRFKDVTTGRTVLLVPMEYGYGETCLQTAFEVLVENGYYSTKENSNGSFVDYPKFLHEFSGGGYSITDVKLKSNL